MTLATDLARIGPRVVLVLLLAGIGACRSETSEDPPAVPNPDTTGMQARVLVQIRQLRQEVLENSQSAEAWGTFGMANDTYRIFDAAEVCYRRAAQLAPNDFRYPYLLGSMLNLLGIRSDDSVRLLREAAKLEPRYAPAHHRVGDILSRQGKYGEARDAFKRALEISDEPAISHRSLGQVLLVLGDARSAIEQLEKVLQLHPNDGPTLSALAQSYRRVGEHELARETLAKSTGSPGGPHLADPVRAQVNAIGVSSNHFLDRANPLMAAGRYGEALPHLKIVEEARPHDPFIQTWLGLAYLNTGQQDAAFDHFSRAVRKKDDLPLAHMNLGSILLRRGQAEESIPHFERALQLAPQNRTVHSHLAAAFCFSGRFQDGVAQYEQAQTLGQLGVKDHLNWGSALWQLQDREQALTHYREAVKISPRSTAARFKLADALERLGHTVEAVEHYRVAALIDPNHPAARRLEELEGK